MRCKMLTVVALSLALFSTGCSTLKKVVYQPDIHQGNYLSAKDIEQIKVGMTKLQVAYVLGSPMLTDTFGGDTWFYIFRQQFGHQDIQQQRLTLSFDQQGLLLDIKNEQETLPAK